MTQMVDILQLVGKINRFQPGVLTDPEKVLLTRLLSVEVKTNGSRMGNDPISSKTRRALRGTSKPIPKTEGSWMGAGDVDKALSKRLGLFTRGAMPKLVSKARFCAAMDILGVDLQYAVQRGVEWGRIEVIAGGLQYKIIPLQMLIEEADSNDCKALGELFGCTSGRAYTILMNKT